MIKPDDITEYKSGEAYFSTADYPWTSPETDELLELAKKKFRQLKAAGKSVWLVVSHHWASQGYWVELDKPKLSGSDAVIATYIKQ